MFIETTTVCQAEKRSSVTSCRDQRARIQGQVPASSKASATRWIAAKLIDEMGATVVAASDSSGGIYNPDGFDPVAAKDHKNETGSVVGFAGSEEEITNEDVLTLDVDLLIPAALENAVDADLAEDVKADVISEAANGPLTPAADEVLEDKDVFVIPDILANAGGVTVSYFEWVQNRQRFAWSEERVNEELEGVIVDAFEEAGTWP